MNFMEEFKNDLIDLFKKHKIMALEGSVELHFRHCMTMET